MVYESKDFAQDDTSSFAESSGRNALTWLVAGGFQAEPERFW